MSRIRNGAQLSRQSWSALLSNRQLLVFPLMSLVGMFFVTLIFLVPEIVVARPYLEAEDPSSVQTFLALGVLFLYYLAAYTVVIFSNTALIAATMKIIEGEEATVADGLNAATARLGKIVPYAVVSATIGVLAHVVSRSGRGSDNALGSIIAMLLGAVLAGAWSIVVFFAIPVMVYEDLGFVDSLKRSMELFKQTWGEGFVGRTAIGLVSWVLGLAIGILCAAIVAVGLSYGNMAIVVVGVVLGIVGIVMVGLMQGAVNGIFQASLYHYATTGDSGPFIDSRLAAEAFGDRE